jgi:hypothetical protein
VLHFADDGCRLHTKIALKMDPRTKHTGYALLSPKSEGMQILFLVDANMQIVKYVSDFPCDGLRCLYN